MKVDPPLKIENVILSEDDEIWPGHLSLTDDKHCPPDLAPSVSAQFNQHQHLIKMR